MALAGLAQDSPEVLGAQQSRRLKVIRGKESIVHPGRYRSLCAPSYIPAINCLQAYWVPSTSSTKLFLLSDLLICVVQAYEQVGNTSPDVRTSLVKAAYATTQELIKQRQISAGHDISDGGVAVTLLEMAFAGNCGIQVTLFTPFASAVRYGCTCILLL